jgi:hypothetical protein
MSSFLMMDVIVLWRLGIKRTYFYNSILLLKTQVMKQIHPLYFFRHARV